MTKCIILKLTLLIAIELQGTAFAQAPQQPPTASDPVIKKLATQIEPAQEMRNLVRDISKYARRFNRNFGIIAQGGLDILEKVKS